MCQLFLSVSQVQRHVNLFEPVLKAFALSMAHLRVVNSSDWILM